MIFLWMISFVDIFDILWVAAWLIG